MNYAIDIILVCVMLLIVFLSTKRGIIVTVIDLVAGIAAFIFAKAAAPAAAEGLYNAVVRNIVLEFLTEKYAGIENSVADALSNVMSAFDFLPEGILSFIEASGYTDTDALATGIMNGITTVPELESKVVAPVVIAVLNLLCFAVLAIVFLVGLRIAGRFVAKMIRSVKIAGKLDSLLGGVFGVLKGGLYAFIIAAVINVVSFSSEALANYAANSYICSFVAGIIG